MGKEPQSHFIINTLLELGRQLLFFGPREKARTKEDITSMLYAMWGIANMKLPHHFYIHTHALLLVRASRKS